LKRKRIAKPAEKKCTNTLKAATSEIVCDVCEHNVHNDCCEILEYDHKLTTYCRKCVEKKLNTGKVTKHNQDRAEKRSIGRKKYREKQP
jgi:hypothetical protein